MRLLRKLASARRWDRDLAAGVIADEATVRLRKVFSAEDAQRARCANARASQAAMRERERLAESERRRSGKGAN